MSKISKIDYIYITLKIQEYLMETNSCTEWIITFPALM